MSKPLPDELELSLFGPGYGECVVLHLGDDEWIVVDSCIDRDTRKPVALDYFRTLGIDPGKSVRLVVATHWHDDHVRGLGEVLSACRGADFACPAALQSDEFLHLVALFGRRPIASMSGVTAFAQVFEIAANRNMKRPGNTPALRFALENTKLWSSPATGQRPRREVLALSPSASSLIKAQTQIASLLPKTSRVPAPERNDGALALWVEVGGDHLLLGSDLEEATMLGWTAVLGLKLGNRASVFKIPHHGSENGHCAGVWTSLLQPEPIAALTPFWRGNVKLPGKTDQDRLKRDADRVLITNNGTGTKPPKRSGAVAKKIIQVVRSIRLAQPPVGHVRLRKRTGEANWRVDLANGAVEL